jgi:hypothetical protein
MKKPGSPEGLPGFSKSWEEIGTGGLAPKKQAPGQPVKPTFFPTK